MKMNEPDKRLVSAESISGRSACARVGGIEFQISTLENNLRRALYIIGRPASNSCWFSFSVIKMQMGLSNKSLFNFSGPLLNY